MKWSIRFRCFGTKPIFPPTKKAVVVSTSHDIFSNLAMENWIYKNQPFADNGLLMLWSNEPCVVIGRHQNPWSECDVGNLQSMGISLARRHSGGGAVYHDRGNLNLTFFTKKEHYHRAHNLEFLADCLRADFNLRVEINPREDLTLRDCKISGTAAKLARLTAYHHCTLLINADTQRLRKALRPPKWQIETNATKSFKSKILNLSEEDAALDLETLTKSIALRYLRFNNINTTENAAYMNRVITNTNQAFGTGNIEEFAVSTIDFNSLKIHLMEPDEKSFPGITEFRNELTDWKWVFGKTPKFTVSKTFKADESEQRRSYAFSIVVKVEAGLMSEIDVKMPNGYAGQDDLLQKLEKVYDLKGTEYSDDVLNYLERHFDVNDAFIEASFQ